MGSSLGRNNTSVKTTRLSTQNELAVSGLIMAMNCLARMYLNNRNVLPISADAEDCDPSWDV